MIYIIQDMQLKIELFKGLFKYLRLNKDKKFINAND